MPKDKRCQGRNSKGKANETAYKDVEAGPSFGPDGTACRQENCRMATWQQTEAHRFPQ